LRTRDDTRGGCPQLPQLRLLAPHERPSIRRPRVCTEVGRALACHPLLVRGKRLLRLRFLCGGARRARSLGRGGGQSCDRRQDERGRDDDPKKPQGGQILPVEAADILRVMPTRPGIGALLLSALALAGCGGGDERPDQDPGAFISELVHDVAAGRYAQAWTTLYPPHQQVATRQEYLRCEPMTPFPGKVENVRVLEVFDEPVDVAGQADQVDSTAIIVRLTVRAENERDRFDSTFHAVAVDGKWTWFLPEQRYEAYVAGDCFFQ
jgi:hypothetical protein